MYIAKRYSQCEKTQQLKVHHKNKLCHGHKR